MSSWYIQATGQVVKCYFRGHLSANGGFESSQNFEEKLLDSGFSRVEFHVEHMTGFENEARHHWANAMRRQRDRICSVTTFGANFLVRMGASVLGMVAGIQVNHKEESNS